MRSDGDQDGRSFIDEFVERTKDYSKYIYKSDLCSLVFQSSSPILFQSSPVLSEKSFKIPAFAKIKGQQKFKMAILSLATALGLLTSTASAHLKVLKMGTTVDGTTLPIRGWNSWGLQAAGYIEAFDEVHVRAQCDQMYSTLQGRYSLCGLDSGWSRDGGDENGIIQYDEKKFDLPNFANHIHSKGGLLGVYVVPGPFVSDYNKTIKGTNTKIRDICHHEYGFVRCALNYDHPDTQKWFNSNAAQFAAW